MGDSIADSLALVHSISPLRAILMLSWGLMLLLIHYSWLKGASPSFLRALRPLDELPRAWIVWASWAISGAAVLFVFATGVDWIRWFCSAGTSILVIGALLLLRHPNSGDRTWTGDFSPALVAIGVYFATRPVLPPMGTDSIKGLLDWWL
ncbi:hypothetical protein GA0111570_101123 [Raineyella antarctica]|uniref:Uncharacterized protein n=2 Tax=Raineyella antarctica TaxID=1577474 RepID=A0A1G6GCX5_9ACTN|nr:hypothetical protein GA0111570_101123 [Raineyella antarctica]